MAFVVLVLKLPTLSLVAHAVRLRVRFSFNVQSLPLVGMIHEELHECGELPLRGAPRSTYSEVEVGVASHIEPELGTLKHVGVVTANVHVRPDLRCMRSSSPG